MKVHWISQRQMCRPKLKGGLRFKYLKAFNLVLLAKQGRRIMQETSTFLHQIFKARYFINNSFIDLRVDHTTHPMLGGVLWLLNHRFARIVDKG